MSYLSRSIAIVGLIVGGAAFLITFMDSYTEELKYRIDELEGQINMMEQSHKLEREEIIKAYGETLIRLNKEIKSYKKEVLSNKILI
jgi:hypothetical protein